MVQSDDEVLGGPSVSYLEDAAEESGDGSGDEAVEDLVLTKEDIAFTNVAKTTEAEKKAMEREAEDLDSIHLSKVAALMMEEEKEKTGNMMDDFISGKSMKSTTTLTRKTTTGETVRVGGSALDNADGELQQKGKGGGVLDYMNFDTDSEEGEADIDQQQITLLDREEGDDYMQRKERKGRRVMDARRKERMELRASHVNHGAVNEGDDEFIDDGEEANSKVRARRELLRSQGSSLSNAEHQNITRILGGSNDIALYEANLRLPVGMPEFSNFDHDLIRWEDAAANSNQVGYGVEKKKSEESEMFLGNEMAAAMMTAQDDYIREANIPEDRLLLNDPAFVKRPTPSSTDIEEMSKDIFGRLFDNGCVWSRYCELQNRNNQKPYADGSPQENTVPTDSILVSSYYSQETAITAINRVLTKYFVDTWEPATISLLGNTLLTHRDILRVVECVKDMEARRLKKDKIKASLAILFLSSPYSDVAPLEDEDITPEQMEVVRAGVPVGADWEQLKNFEAAADAVFDAMSTAWAICTDSRRTLLHPPSSLVDSLNLASSSSEIADYKEYLEWLTVHGSGNVRRSKRGQTRLMMKFWKGLSVSCASKFELSAQGVVDSYGAGWYVGATPKVTPLEIATEVASSLEEGSVDFILNSPAELQKASRSILKETMMNSPLLRQKARAAYIASATISTKPVKDKISEIEPRDDLAFVKYVDQKPLHTFKGTSTFLDILEATENELITFSVSCGAGYDAFVSEVINDLKSTEKSKAVAPTADPSDIDAILAAADVATSMSLANKWNSERVRVVKSALQSLERQMKREVVSELKREAVTAAAYQVEDSAFEKIKRPAYPRGRRPALGYSYRMARIRAETQYAPSLPLTHKMMTQEEKEREFCHDLPEVEAISNLEEDDEFPAGVDLPQPAETLTFTGALDAEFTSAASEEVEERVARRQAYFNEKTRKDSGASGARVVSIVPSTDRDVATMAVSINGHGEYMDSMKLSFAAQYTRLHFATQRARVDAERVAFSVWLRDQDPDLVVVGAASHQTNKIYESVYTVCAQLLQIPLVNGDLVGPGPEFDSVQGMPPVTASSHTNVILSEVSLSSMWARSPDCAAGSKHYKDLPVPIRVGIHLARTGWNPVTSYTDLAPLAPVATTEGAPFYIKQPIQNYKWHPRSDFMPEARVGAAVTAALQRGVAAAGVDLHEVLAHSLAQGSVLAYAPGLGHRKAQSILNTMQPGSAVDRETIEKLMVRGKQGLVARNFLSCVYVPNRYNNFTRSPLDSLQLDFRNERETSWALQICSNAIEACDQQTSFDDSSQTMVLAMSCASVRRVIGVMELWSYVVGSEEMDENTPEDPTHPTYIGVQRVAKQLMFGGWKGIRERAGRDAARTGGGLGPNREEVFQMITFVDPKSMEPGTPIDVVIDDVKPGGARVILENQIRGWLPIRSVTNQFVEDSSSVLQVGTTMSAVVDRLELEHFKATVSVLPEMIDPLSYITRRFQGLNFYNANGWVEEIEAKRQANLQPVTNFVKRNVKHTRFKNWTANQTRDHMENPEVPVGTVVIRPSSKGQDVLTMSWKTSSEPPLYASVTIHESEKVAVSTLGSTLTINGKRFASIEQILARYLKPMNKSVKALRKFKRFINGDKKMARRHLIKARKEDPRSVPYSVSINAKAPKNFIIGYMVKKQEPKFEPVRISPKGMTFRNKDFKDVARLIAYFKRHYKEDPPQPIASEGSMAMGSSAAGAPMEMDDLAALSSMAEPVSYNYGPPQASGAYSQSQAGEFHAPAGNPRYADGPSYHNQQQQYSGPPGGYPQQQPYHGGGGHPQYPQHAPPPGAYNGGDYSQGPGYDNRGPPQHYQQPHYPQQPAGAHSGNGYPSGDYGPPQSQGSYNSQGQGQSHQQQPPQQSQGQGHQSYGATSSQGQAPPPSSSGPSASAPAARGWEQPTNLPPAPSAPMAAAPAPQAAPKPRSRWGSAASASVEAAAPQAPSADVTMDLGEVEMED